MIEKIEKWKSSQVGTKKRSKLSANKKVKKWFKSSIKKKSSSYMEKQRKDLTWYQRKTIQSETIWGWRWIIIVFLPWIYLLWARAYFTFFLFNWIWLLMSLFGIEMIALRRIWMRFWIFYSWSARAFNNSKWYLKKLAEDYSLENYPDAYRWGDKIVQISIDRDRLWKKIDIDGNKILFPKNSNIWDSFTIKGEWEEWVDWWEHGDLAYVIVNIKET